MRFLALLTALIIFSFPAYAEEEEKSVIYQPEGCEFAITFPDEPYSSQRCNPGNPTQCSDFTSFTKVFGIEATVNFTVSCYPANENMYEQYSEEVMQATLKAMLSDQNLDIVETDSQTLPYAKQAVALGTGRIGNSDRLFSAQLWIGKKSVYTIEAELVGKQLDIADEMFMDIIGSFQHESEMDKKDEEKTKNAGTEKEKTQKNEAE